ncbi:lymphocyte activation gene 3 protein isoform X2 [Dipodomys spectabilis]|uniref:lymphocyte activation gene 3 protein isoform X2 n=1 Tax=Dipodomys spectabilis TaxID=105255 RepID=UPI001C541495|nr:lymphocyte activation gene 3 protein isoform X2 [Dipodomys spectabilis]
MREAQVLGWLLPLLLGAAPGAASGGGEAIPVVWAQEGAPARLPCGPAPPLQQGRLPGSVRLTWRHQPDSPPTAASPGGSPGPLGYTVLSVSPEGLRLRRPPLGPRVQLAERGLQRGDFSLRLCPALRADAGQYRATVHLGDRALSCHLRLRLGQASMTASPPGSLRTSDRVALKCSFERPESPASVRWFRGQGRGRVPVQESARHHMVESFLFLPQVGPTDSGTWGCVLTYTDGFRVTITHNLEVLGLEPPAPLTVYAAAGSRAELPCHLPSDLGNHTSLAAQWTPPGGGPDLPVAGHHGNFTLRLQAVSVAQAGSYTCRVRVPGQSLQITITLAVITVTPKSGKLLCEVTPASGGENFVWRPLDPRSKKSSPGPWLEAGEAGPHSQPWQCQVYQRETLLGAAKPLLESRQGARRSGKAPGSLGGSRLALLLALGALLLVTGAFGFHHWRRQWLQRRFSALELGTYPPQAPSKTEEWELDLEPEMEQELEPPAEPELTQL